MAEYITKYDKRQKLYYLQTSSNQVMQSSCQECGHAVFGTETKRAIRSGCVVNIHIADSVFAATLPINITYDLDCFSPNDKMLAEELLFPDKKSLLDYYKDQHFAKDIIDGSKE